MDAHERRNNFRFEKRHYRKGFYFDCWLHPKTYPRTYSTPETIEHAEPVDQPIEIVVPQIVDSSAKVEGTSKASETPNSQSTRSIDTTQPNNKIKIKSNNEQINENQIQKVEIYPNNNPAPRINPAPVSAPTSNMIIQTRVLLPVPNN